MPSRAQRWLTIDDYVSGYLDHCVDVIRERSEQDTINMLGICQGGVFTACYAALFPEKVRASRSPSRRSISTATRTTRKPAPAT